MGLHWRPVRVQIGCSVPTASQSHNGAPSLSVASKFEGCGIEKNEGRRVERSEGVLVGLGLTEDGENDASVNA
jgi:hypothetical protein